jgi:hypothetical protein
MLSRGAFAGPISLGCGVPALGASLSLARKRDLNLLTRVVVVVLPAAFRGDKEVVVPARLGAGRS